MWLRRLVVCALVAASPVQSDNRTTSRVRGVITLSPTGDTTKKCEIFDAEIRASQVETAYLDTKRASGCLFNFDRVPIGHVVQIIAFYQRREEKRDVVYM